MSRFESGYYTKKVDVEKLTLGEVLQFDIFTREGALVLEGGSVITQDNLVRLKRLKAQLVTFNFERLYAEAVASSRILLTKAGNAEDVTREEVLALVQPFYHEISQHRLVSRMLLKLSPLGDYTVHHTVNVGILSMILGKWLGFSNEEISSLSIAGVLHDIGKSRIPPEIINKPTALSIEEYECLKKHPVYGAELLDKYGGYEEGVRLSVLQHHEREDGSGYPLGLKSKEIHTYAKIVAIADVYHAMNSERVYKDKQNPFYVLDYLKKSLYTLDAGMVYTFVENMLQHLMGSYVLLSDGRRGQVIYLNQANIASPVVKAEDSGEILELDKRRDLKVKEVLEMA